MKWTDEYKIYFGSIIFMAILLYGVGAFINWNINAGEWSVAVRASITILWSGFIIVVSQDFDKEKSK